MAEWVSGCHVGQVDRWGGRRRAGEEIDGGMGRGKWLVEWKDEWGRLCGCRSPGRWEDM